MRGDGGAGGRAARGCPSGAARRKMRRMRTLLTAAAMALVAPTLAAQPPAARGILVGAVRDSAGAPVAGASVELDGAGRWVGVGSDGAYRIADVAPGEHVVRARAIGFAGPSRAWPSPQFAGPTARCGVIVLWTRAMGAGPG